MIIIPAVDIIKGKVVRLHKGDFNKEKVYSDDPVEAALSWQKKGAEFLHLVDLDGAKYGEVKNKEAITDVLKAIDVPSEIGGGLRSEIDIEYFLKIGARRVVIGTKAFEDADYLKRLVQRFGEKIVVSVDFSEGKVAKRGWQEKIDMSPVALARDLEGKGVKTIVVTDIATDGTLSGPNIEGLKEILESVDISVIASGGVSGPEDIKRLKALASRNLEGVIVGRALYEEKLDLEEAIKIAKS